MFRSLIEEADYLSFAIGGLFGDWGAVACFEAHRLGRRFAVWTDRVESEVVRRAAGSGPWQRRVAARLTHRPMARLERAVIGRAALGLFHGRETYEAYASFCRGVPALVHDIHVRREEHISFPALAAKVAKLSDGPLRICYAGRADPMKGPLNWLEVLERLAARGCDFRAVWLGEGAERDRMLRRIGEAGLEGRVEAPGVLTDRAELLARIREAHVFMFCHKTPESPRCLIEALLSGTPIVGYDSAFPRDLIATHGGGRLVPLGDMSALADAVESLALDRAELARLVAAAADDGRPFDDENVFRHRSELIKQHLGR
jgi:colanic acid/amylovoran biosynthesis glycosyltransferase